MINQNENVLLRERELLNSRERSRSRSKDASFNHNNSGYSPLKRQGASPIDPIANASSPIYDLGHRGSPLRRSTSPNDVRSHERRSPPRIVPSLADDNQARMRKSQERIAAILGMDRRANQQ